MYRVRARTIKQFVLAMGVIMTCCMGCSLAAGSSPAPITLVDFSAPDIIQTLLPTASVKVAVVDDGGGKALEVTVPPFSQHKDSWPYVSFDPKVLKKAFDLSEYSYITADVNNVTDGYGRIAFYMATLPYNDHGLNVDFGLTNVPGKTKMACNIPLNTLERNDPSNVNYVQIIFQVREQEAVYRIGNIRAVYDPAVGSPAEALRMQVKAADAQFAAFKTLNGEKIASSQALQGEVQETGETIADLKAAVGLSGDVSMAGQYKNLQARLADVTRKMGLMVLEGEKVFGVWSIDTYANFTRDEAPSGNSAIVKSLSARMAQGEFRHNLLMITAIDSDVELQASVTPAKGLPTGAIKLERIDYAPNMKDIETGDLVYPLAEPIQIPKGQSRQIRVRFDTRNNKIAPGQYSFKVNLKDLESGLAKTLPGTLEVWNIQLPNYDVIRNNGYSQLEESNFTPEALHAVVRDMKMNGQNVLYVSPLEVPKPLDVDDAGNIGRFDDTAFYARIKPFVKDWNAAPGNDTVFFIFATSGFTPNFGQPEGKFKFGSEPWKNLLGQWLRHFKAVVKECGIADDKWAMTLTDEATEAALITYELPMAEAIKSLEPGIKIVCNSSAVLEDPEIARRYFAAIDIFQPDYWFGFKSDPRFKQWLLTNAKKTGRTIWSYQCAGDWNQKGKNTYAYYRVYLWQLWNDGMTGAGLWTYCAHMTAHAKNGYLMIFNRDDKMVPSRRYALFNEGLDDYRYLSLLNTLAKKKGPAAQKQADKLISDAVADITADTSDVTRCDKWRVKVAAEILKLKSPAAPQKTRGKGKS